MAIVTNASAAVMRADAEALIILNRAPEVLVCAVVVGELLASFAHGRREANSRRERSELLGDQRFASRP